MILMRGRAAAAASLFLTLLAATHTLAAEPKPARYEFTQIHMGTRFRIVLYAENARAAERAAHEAFKRIEKLDGTMSDYRETSELMGLCRRAGGGWVTVSRDLFRVLRAAQKLSAQTGGAFDVTIGPVTRLWRHARRTNQQPDAHRLARALSLTGYAKLHLDEKKRAVRLDQAGMLLDLGGIAKGFAADEAMLVLRRRGISRALVAAGGDIVAGDAPPGMRGWQIGILPLSAPARMPLRQLSLRRAAVSTSGDSEQYAEIDGVRYSHITDPRTGIGTTGSSSVTVIAPRGTLADAMATAVSVLGPERGLKLIDTMEGAAALVMRAAGNDLHTFASQRWTKVLQGAAASEKNADRRDRGRPRKQLSRAALRGSPPL